MRESTKQIANLPGENFEEDFKYFCRFLQLDTRSSEIRVKMLLASLDDELSERLFA